MTTPVALTTASEVPVRSSILVEQLGLLAESSPLGSYVAGAALTSQRVQGVAIGLRAGDVVSSLAFCVTVAAVNGGSPTHMRACLAGSTGTVLIRTADVTAAASWPIGIVSVPLSANYTVLADGLYYVVIVQNGAFGTTQPSFARAAAVDVSQNAAIGSAPPRAWQWAAQTDLPAVNSALTITAATAYTIWAAAVGTPISS